MSEPLEHISGLVRARELRSAAIALEKRVRKKSARRVDWRGAANLANAIGDQDLALAALERWRRESPADPVRQVAVINALGAVARYQEAALAIWYVAAVATIWTILAHRGISPRARV